MSLDIRLAGDLPGRAAPGPGVSFDDDGYYWFLHPLWEDLQRQTGQYIDLYDGATFSGPALVALRDTLAEGRRRVMAQPDEWQVHVGDNVGSYLHLVPPTPIYSTVRKATFLELLHTLESLVTAAERTGGRIICLGD